MQFVSVYDTTLTETRWVTNGNFHYVGGQNEQGFTRSYLVQPNDQKHWSFEEWLWMMVTSLHPYVLQELRGIHHDTTIVYDDRFTHHELVQIQYAACYLLAGGNPESFPQPATPDNWIELALSSTGSHPAAAALI